MAAAANAVSIVLLLVSSLLAADPCLLGERAPFVASPSRHPADIQERGMPV